MLIIHITPLSYIEMEPTILDILSAHPLALPLGIELVSIAFAPSVVEILTYTSHRVVVPPLDRTIARAAYLRLGTAV